MDIVCSSCKSRFNIPDSKIPQGKRSSFPCPKCSEKIVIIPPTKSSMTKDYDASDKPFDYIEDKGKSALICESDPELRKKEIRAASEMDFRTVEADTVDDAVKKMRYHLFDLVIVNESFDNSEPGSNKIMEHLSLMNMSERRKIFSVLVSSTLRTMDNMAALNRSMNMIINTGSMTQITKVMMRGLSDYEKKYKVFMDSQIKTGRL